MDIDDLLSLLRAGRQREPGTTWPLDAHGQYVSEKPTSKRNRNLLPNNGC